MNELPAAAEEKAESTASGRWFWFCLAGFMVLLFAFFKNAWVCDDAYLNFRSIEQLFAGNGPNWNPHERVQVYTSPLWYWFLALARLISPDPFFNVIILSFILILLLAYVLYRNLSAFSAGVAFFLLAASNAFVDFSTSGLENILAAFLAAASAFYCAQAFDQENRATSDSKAEIRALICLSLLPICRHDLSTIALPIACLLILARNKRWGDRLKKGLLVVFPLIIWSLFSLIYYGALFPNTAYAKIFTGIPRGQMFSQGLRYFLVTFQQDPLTLMTLLVALFIGIRTRDPFGRSIAVAIAVNLTYIAWVGGDFMRGRFFTTAFVLAVIFLARFMEKENPIFCTNRLCTGMAVFYIVYLLLFPFTPVNTGLTYSNFNLDHGIADERGYYFDVCSLYSYLYSEPGAIFPDFEWSHIGRQIAESKVNYLENDFNGMLGYWAGTSTVIIDRLALADPYLARIPVATIKGWRIGHFKRDVDAHYRKSIESDQNLFPPGKGHDLFELVRFASRERVLFSIRRLVAILRLNLGLY